MGKEGRELLYFFYAAGAGLQPAPNISVQVTNLNLPYLEPARYEQRRQRIIIFFLTYIFSLRALRNLCVLCG